MVGMVAVAYATLGQRWLQVGKPTVVFSTSAQRQIYRRLSSMYLPTVSQRWLKVIKLTVILSTSAHRQLQTSILRAFAYIGPTLAQGKKANGHFSTSAHRQLQTSILRVIADIGPTLAQGGKANCHFVNVSPPSGYRRLSSVYLPTLGQRWLKVKKPTVFFP